MTTAMTMPEIVIEPRVLQRLLAWFSPAFPIGAFAYSAGLETAIATNRIASARNLEDWLAASLSHGAPFTDAILLTQAHRKASDPSELTEIADLAIALIPARQRVEESRVLGSAFIQASAAWPQLYPVDLPDPCPFPVALGALTAAQNVPLPSVVLAFLTGYVQAQISVAIRLVPLGQTDGLAVLAALEPLVATQAKAATGAQLDDIGSIGFAADIAAMAHETLPSRIFRS